MKEEVGPFLSTIVPLLVEAVDSVEGTSLQLKGGGENEFPTGDLLDDEDDDVSPMGNYYDDDDEEVIGYTVENSYLEEKKEACLALGELASHAQ